jgi:hypothetical protein
MLTCLCLPATSSWLFADDTLAIATSSEATLLVKYLGTYHSDLVLWLRKWRIAINVSKGSAMLFARAGRLIPNRDQFSFTVSQSSGVTLDIRLISIR